MVRLPGTGLGELVTPLENVVADRSGGHRLDPQLAKLGLHLVEVAPVVALGQRTKGGEFLGTLIAPDQVVDLALLRGAAQDLGEAEVEVCPAFPAKRLHARPPAIVAVSDDLTARVYLAPQWDPSGKALIVAAALPETTAQPYRVRSVKNSDARIPGDQFFTDEKESTLTAIDVASGVSTMLMPGPVVLRSFRVSPTGRHVIYVAPAPELLGVESARPRADRVTMNVEHTDHLRAEIDHVYRCNVDRWTAHLTGPVDQEIAKRRLVTWACNRFRDSQPQRVTHSDFTIHDTFSILPTTSRDPQLRARVDR